MKRFGLVPSILLLILFAQSNHVALTALSSPHKNFGVCAEAQKTKATEKCLCCALQQADHPSPGNLIPPFPFLSHRTVNLSHQPPLISENQGIASPQKIPVRNRLKTVVQNK